MLSNALVPITMNAFASRCLLFCWLVLPLLPQLVAAAPSAEQAAQIEKTFAAWLAAPEQTGAAPKRAKYSASVTTKLPGGASAEVHLVEYETSEGVYGKGFANPVPMSFGPLPYKELSDVQLVTAYTGWLLLVSGLENKSIVTSFKPKTELTLQRELKAKGLTNIVIKEKYRVDTAELFEFQARKGGKQFLGAGQAGAALLFEQGSPEAALPVIYTFLGKLQRGEL
jgi:hypothetical protein